MYCRQVKKIFAARSVTMIFLFIFTAFATSCSHLSMEYKRQVRRVKTVLNNDWLFTDTDDSGYIGQYDHDRISTPYSRKKYDDSEWQRIHIPHCFDIPVPFPGWQGYVDKRATCWYRKHFEVSDEFRGKRVFLEFEGAYQHAYIWVNDKFIGDHKGGYIGFSLDITDAVEFGADNVLSVKVSNEMIGEDRLISLCNFSDYAKHGGIYRDVYLLVTDELYVDFSGTYVSTPVVSADLAKVKIETQVTNADKSNSKKCTLTSRILDAKNRLVATIQDSQKIAAGTTHTFVQISPDIAYPQLWSLDRPYLYTVQTIVEDGGKVVDNYMTTFGVRWFEIDGEEGFFLNGERVFLRGYNIHQDEYGWGSACANSKFYRDIKMLKECGTRMVRMSHYPQDPTTYKACDELGVLVMDELSFCMPDSYKDKHLGVGPILQNKGARDYLRDTLRDILKQHRNSPSIVMFCLANETHKSLGGFKDIDSTVGFFAELNDMAHTLSGRATITHTRERSGSEYSRAINTLVDVIGWYDFDNTYEHYRKSFLCTEAGEGDDDSPKPKVSPGEYTHHGVRAEEMVYNQSAWIAGGLVWCAFDYTCPAWPGIISYNRLPKKDYYWCVNNWLHNGLPEPKWPAPGTPASIQLTVDKTSIKTDGTDDCYLRAVVLDNNNVHINNTVPVTFKVTKGNGLFPGGSSITIDSDQGLGGQTGIPFRSYTNGIVEITATAPGLKPGMVIITCSD